MNFQINEVFNKFAAVIKSRIVNEPSSCYLLHDNEIDITILKHSILENDRNPLYLVRPSGTCLLRCDKYFYPKYYLRCRGDYKSFIYVHLDLHSGEAKEITWEQADDMLSSPGKPPLKGNLGRFEYIKVVVEDLRIRGYADYLPAYNLDDLRRFALQDDRPSLVRYIDNVMATV